MADLKTRIIISAVDNTKLAFKEATAAADRLKSTLLGFASIGFLGFVSKEIVSSAEKWLILNAQIKNATKSSEDFAIAQQAVVDISNKTFTSLDANAVLLAKINRALSDMGGDINQAVGLTDIIAKLAGMESNAAGAAAGVYQLTQAIASGKFAGDEFRSVSEQLPILADALAKGLGKNRDMLRTMSKEGELGTAEIMRGLYAQAAEVDKMFANMPVTIGKSLQLLENKWIEFTGRLNESKGITGALAQSVKFLADNLKVLAEAGLDIGVSLLAGGLAAGIALIINYSKATALATLETKANLVANAQAQAAEKARIASIQAKVVSQLADVRATIAQTRATIAQNIADIRSTNSMLAGNISIQTRTTLNLQRQALNTQLIASQALLNEQLAAETALLNANKVSLLSFSTIFSAALALFAGYEIGSWGVRNFAWIEGAKVALQDLFDRFLLFKDFATFQIDSTQVKQGLKDIEEKYAASYAILNDGSENQRKENDKRRKKEIEDAKEVEDKKLKAIEDAFKKQQGILETKNEIRKSNLDQELAEIELLGVKRIAELSKEVASDDIRNRKSLEIQRQIEQDKLNLTIKYNQDRLKDTTALYDKEIEKQKKNKYDTQSIEKEAAQAKKAILLESQKAYDDSIKKSIESEKQLRDKALGYRKELLEFQRTTSERNLELQNIGLSERRQAENASLQISRNASAIRQQLATGDYQSAADAAKKNTDLAFEQARSAKQAFLDGKISRSEMETAEFDYQNTVDDTSQVLKQAAIEADKQAEAEVKKRDEQIASLETVKAKITEVDTAIKTLSKIEIIVDSSRIDDLKGKIEEATKPRVIEISWSDKKGLSDAGQQKNTGAQTTQASPTVKVNADTTQVDTAKTKIDSLAAPITTPIKVDIAQATTQIDLLKKSTSEIMPEKPAEKPVIYKAYVDGKAVSFGDAADVVNKAVGTERINVNVDYNAKGLKAGDPNGDLIKIPVDTSRIEYAKDEITKLPDATELTANVDSSQIDDLNVKIENEIPKEKVINIKWTSDKEFTSVPIPQPNGYEKGGFIKPLYRAAGGWIADFWSGKFAKGTDSVPIMATPDEYMLTVPETKSLNEMGFFDWLKSPNFGKKPQYFSSGGFVTPSSFSSPTLSSGSKSNGETFNLNLSLGDQTVAASIDRQNFDMLKSLSTALEKQGRVTR